MWYRRSKSCFLLTLLVSSLCLLLTLVYNRYPFDKVLDLHHPEQKAQPVQPLFQQQEGHPDRPKEAGHTEETLKSKEEKRNLHKEGKERPNKEEQQEEKRNVHKEEEEEEEEEEQISMDKEREESLDKENEKSVDKGTNKEADKKDKEEDVRSLGDKGNVTRVILLSYMRSGSSFTADLFNQHRKVFYLYEPLWNYDFAFKHGNPMIYLDGRPPVIYKDNPTQMDTLKKDTIRSYLSCHLQHVGSLDFAIMKKPWAARRTKRIQDFLTCWQHVDQIQTLKKCLPLIQKDCDTANVTVVKTLRFTMTQALTLMESDPRVKVIHLVRDPRGILNSRKRTGVGWNYHETFQYICGRILQDVEDSMTIRKTYPGRVLTIRYEDLTSDPLKYTEQLLRFANLDFRPQHMAYVKMITSVKEAGQKSAVARKDAQAMASLWRGQISFDFVKDGDEHCAGLYNTMGYLPFPEEHMLRNLTHPSYVGCRDVEVPVLCLN